MPKILIVGGGYAGFYTAWKLEKWLRPGEAEVTVVDPLPYMTYQPFLPEVAAGSIEPRHSVVALRRHLKKTTVVTAKVTGIDHASKTATITPEVGEPWQFDYDVVVVTGGAVSRTFPIPGIADKAIGLKTIEEAVAIRDRVLTNFDKAANLPAGPERDRLLTFVVVGGGFAGIEVFAELRSFASALLEYYPQLTFDDTHFHLIEAMGRIMPEVSLPTSHWVIKHLAQRGRDPPRHAAHERGRRPHRAVDRRDLRVRPHRLDRRRHGQPRDRPHERPPRRGARPHQGPRRPPRGRRGRHRPDAWAAGARRRARSDGRRRRRLLRAQRAARGVPGQAPGEEHRRGAPRRRSRGITSTRTSARSPASASARARSSRARSRSPACSRGSRTAATTASRCRRGSASSACSGAGGTTSGSAATSSRSPRRSSRAPCSSSSPPGRSRPARSLRPQPRRRPTSGEEVAGEGRRGQVVALCCDAVPALGPAPRLP